MIGLFTPTSRRRAMPLTELVPVAPPRRSWWYRVRLWWARREVDATDVFLSTVTEAPTVTLYINRSFVELGFASWASLAGHAVEVRAMFEAYPHEPISLRCENGTPLHVPAVLVPRLVELLTEAAAAWQRTQKGAP